ncbi:MAG: hypothetical protein ACKOC5_15005 [Chloroflexota bacterium]
MYLSWTGRWIDLLIWALLMLLPMLGGWLLCACLFSLKAGERLFAGLAVGLLLFMVFSGLLGQLLPLAAAFWAAAVTVLLLGLAALLHSRRSGAPAPSAWQDLRHWQAPAAWLALFGLFFAINRGLAIFDDFSNLPIVSIIAANGLPPVFYLNPNLALDYHYGLHLLAAALVRVGGLYPWVAWDVLKALSISLAAVLGVLWYRRFAGAGRIWRQLLLVAAGLFVLFAGGSRWLFLLLPEAARSAVSAQVQLIGSGLDTAPDLGQAVLLPWNIEGGGPFPFAFAFISGVSRPLSLAMGGSSAMPTLALMLLLLLDRRRWSLAQALLYGLLIVSLAMLSDHLFALLIGGLGLAVLLRALLDLSRSGSALPFRRRLGFAVRRALPWIGMLLPGLVLAPLLSGVLVQLLGRLSGGTLDQGGAYLPGIVLRWPPAVSTSHFSPLSLLQPAQLLAALIEIGPLLLLALPVIAAALARLHSGRLVFAGLGLAGITAFLAPLVIQFVERDRDITRLTGAALSLWMALGLPYAWLAFRRGPEWRRWALVAGFAAVVGGGLALFPAQLIASAQPQPSYFIQLPDEMMARSYWNRLDPGAWVLDPGLPYRPAVLFGRTSGPAYPGVQSAPLPEFRRLLDGMDAAAIAQAGYRYVYLDRKTLEGFSVQQRNVFLRPCVRLVDQQKIPGGDFRRLYDLGGCGQ